MIFVPPPGAADAIMEAADAGIAVIVAITEGIPVLDMARAMQFLRERPCRLVGRGVERWRRAPACDRAEQGGRWRQRALHSRPCIFDIASMRAAGSGPISPTDILRLFV